MPTSDISGWGKFTLILWKNLCVERSKRAEMLVSILTPMLFFVILVVVRLISDVKTVPLTEYNSIKLFNMWGGLISQIKQQKQIINEVNPSFTHNCFVPRPIVGYAPNRYQAFSELMKTFDKWYRVEIKGFQNCRELRKNMVAEHYLAGVCFDETTLSSSNPVVTSGGFPKHLNYSLIFPSELRFYNDTFIGSHWNSNLLFDYLDSVLPRVDRPNDGGFVGYAREGFLTLQDAIAWSYIRKSIPANHWIPRVSIRRFPHQLKNSDPIVDMGEISLSLVLMAGLAYPVMRLTKIIVSEKQTGLTRGMNSMGASYWTIYAARFVYAGLLMVARSSLVLIIIKIGWRGGYAIYTNSSWLSLLFVLLSYNCVSICFSFMISAFFTDPVTATIVTGMLWIITYIPFLPISNHGNRTQWAGYVFSNTAIGLTLKCVNRLEQNSNGFNWKNFVEPQTGDNDIRKHIIIIYTQSIIYMCIAFIVEYARGQHWLETIFKKFTPQNDVDQNTNEPVNSRYFEADPEDKVPAIRVKNLTHKINGKTLLKNISMNLQKNEITIIAGNDGSGKTLLISIIAGLIPPTYGTVLINSFNIQTQRQLAYADLGICIGDKMLFEGLTIIEQLTFFGRLKGVQMVDISGEVEKYLKAMNMTDMGHMLTINLTFGLKRYLAVCCALIGGSKIVLLDEPSIGMDFHARVLLWQMLNDEKMDRTILLSTNSTQEVEILVDRVAFLSNGELKCYGTTAFVKKLDSQAYHLICIKGEYCDERKVTELIRKFIPSVTLESEIGNEISYVLKEDDIEVFQSLFDELEANAMVVDMESFSIRDFGLREAFLEISAGKLKDNESTHANDRLHGKSGNSDTDKQFAFFKNFERLKGLQLWTSHLQALMLKHFLFDKRHLMLLIVQIFAPMWVTILTFTLSTISVDRESLRPMTFNLQQYPQSVTLVDHRAPPLQKAVIDKYEKIILSIGSGHVVETIGGDTFTKYTMEKQELELETFHKTYLVGISYSSGDIIAWFNNYPLHTAPLALNLLHMALARYMLDDNGIVITVTHDPLPFATQHTTNFVNAQITFGYLLAAYLMLCFSLIWSINIIFLVREYKTRMKLQQFISGVSVSLFWATAFFYYMMKVTIMSVLVLLTVSVLGHRIFLQLHIAGSFLMIMVLTGACQFPYNYLVSTVFGDHMIAYAFGIIIHLLGSSIAWALTELEPKDFSGHFELKESLSLICIFFPHLWMHFALLNIYRGNDMDKMCEDQIIKVISLDLDKCAHLPNCCVQNRLTSTQFGITSEITHLLQFGLITGTIMCIMENRAIKRSLRITAAIPDNTRENAYQDHERRHNLLPTLGEDDGVTQEHLRVFNLRPRDYYDKSLVCKNVTKRYSNTPGVENLNLVLNQYECFCLYGGNGSGKSTLLRILGGDVNMSFGSVFVEGISLKQNPFEVYRRIGYCPQQDALLPEYTGHEVMKIHCLLRGVPRHMVNERCESLAKELGFYAHYHKRIGGYCSGNKRRLSCAIAMIANPAIIYLDDPSSGIDSPGRQQLSLVIHAFCRKGTSVLITAWKLRECERICNRLGFISHGHLLCIGARRDIKDKYAKGYVLEVKFRNNSAATRSTELLGYHYLKLATFVENEFTNSIMKYQYGSNLIFHIPFEAAKFSDIFSKIKSNETSLDINHFEISRATLKTLFLDLEEKEIHLSVAGGDDYVETHL